MIQPAETRFFHQRFKTYWFFSDGAVKIRWSALVSYSWLLEFAQHSYHGIGDSSYSGLSKRLQSVALWLYLSYCVSTEIINFVCEGQHNVLFRPSCISSFTLRTALEPKQIQLGLSAMTFFGLWPFTKILLRPESFYFKCLKKNIFQSFVLIILEKEDHSD